MIQLPREGWRVSACWNGASPDCVVVSDTCSAVCMSTALKSCMAVSDTWESDSQRPHHPRALDNQPLLAIEGYPKNPLKKGKR